LLRQHRQRFAEERLEFHRSPTVLSALCCSGHRTFHRDLLISKVDKRREHILFNRTTDSGGRSSRTAQLLQFVSPLQHHALGCLPAHPWNPRKSSKIIAPDRGNRRAE